MHPDNIIKPHRIDSVNAVLDNIGGDEPKQKMKAQSKPWDSEKSPTQVQLVDVLQFMAVRDYFRAPFRLAIVVSAWDRIRNNRRPLSWVATELPPPEAILRV